MNEFIISLYTIGLYINIEYSYRFISKYAKKSVWDILEIPLVYQSLLDIGSEKMELSFSVTYTGPTYIQSLYENYMLTMNEIPLGLIFTL